MLLIGIKLRIKESSLAKPSLREYIKARRYRLRDNVKV